MGSGNDVEITGSSDVDVSEVETVLECHHTVSFHSGLKSADGIDLGNDDLSTTVSHGGGTSLSDITKSTDDYGFSGNHNVSSTHNSIRKRVLTSINVIEFALGDRVVDVDGWEEELVGFSHVVETEDTGGGFLRYTVTSFGHVAPFAWVGLEVLKDNGTYPLDFLIVSRFWVWLVLWVLLKSNFGFDTLVDE